MLDFYGAAKTSTTNLLTGATSNTEGANRARPKYPTNTNNLNALIHLYAAYGTTAIVETPASNCLYQR